MYDIGTGIGMCYDICLDIIYNFFFFLIKLLEMVLFVLGLVLSFYF